MKRLMLLACVMFFIMGCVDPGGYKALAIKAFRCGYLEAVIAQRNGVITDSMDGETISAIATMRFNTLMEK